MSELDKLNKKRLALVKDLSQVQSDLTDKGQELGILATTHRNDPSYSSTKFENLQGDLSRLKEKRDELQGALDEIELKINIEKAPKRPPELVKAQVAKDKRCLELETDLLRARETLQTRRDNLGRDVYNGGDPGALVDEIEFLERLERGLVAGLAASK